MNKFRDYRGKQSCRMMYHSPLMQLKKIWGASDRKGVNFGHDFHIKISHPKNKNGTVLRNSLLTVHL